MARRTNHLALTEYYIPYRHGLLNEGDIDIASHILVLYKWDQPYVDNHSITHAITHAIKCINTISKSVIYSTLESDQHPVIRNMNNIIMRKKHLCLDIIEYYYANTQHMCCIKKTFWISIFQRRWKKIHKRIKLYRNINRLFRREIGN